MKSEGRRGIARYTRPSRQVRAMRKVARRVRRTRRPADARASEPTRADSPRRRGTLQVHRAEGKPSLPCPEAPRPRGAGCPSAAIPRSYARRVLLAGLGLLTAAALASLAAPTPPAAPARYREGFDHEALLEPGRVYKLAFPVGWMSQVFNAGHRIGVTVASTGAPLYEPNPRTGRPLTIEFPDDAVRAVNTIHHGAERASRMIAPVTRGQ